MRRCAHSVIQCAGVPRTTPTDLMANVTALGSLWIRTVLSWCSMQSHFDLACEKSNSKVRTAGQHGRLCIYAAPDEGKSSLHAIRQTFHDSATCV